MHQKTVTLNDGLKFPALGLGTWLGSTDEPDFEATTQFILHAIKLGYRHIDTAFLYRTESAVGEAIRRSGIPREEFFVVTKLWNHHHRDVARAFELSLKNLGLDYIDLYLMHFPVTFEYTGDDMDMFPSKDGDTLLDRGWSYVETWREMEKLPREKVKSIGVSNFSEKTLDVLLPEARVIPSVNQVELHPYLQQHALRAYCHERNIVLTSYAALGQGDASVMEEASIKALSKKHNATPAQIILSWIIQLGDTVCVKSSNTQRLKDNFRVIQLDEEDMKEIAELDRNKRLANGRDPSQPVMGWYFDELGW